MKSLQTHIICMRLTFSAYQSKNLNKTKWHFPFKGTNSALSSIRLTGYITSINLSAQTYRSPSCI